MRNDWASAIAREFDGVELGDVRLARRCGELARSLASCPDRTLPEACATWKGTKGAYRFLSNDRVTHENVLKPHIDSTVGRCNQRPTVLAIQDTTSLNLTPYKGSMTGLGYIASNRHIQGMLIHNTLAVDADSGEVLGLLGQKVWIREVATHKGESRAQYRHRERESKKWLEGVEYTSEQELSCRLIAVFDREGEVFEAMERLQSRGQSFVIRASRNRLLANGDGYFLEAARNGELIGSLEIEVGGAETKKRRPARLSLRRRTIEMKPPQLRKRSGRPIRVEVVAAIEENPPRGVEAVEWFLLTREPCRTEAECRRVIELYTLRWKIEEFHMGLKTGCRIEERQLKTRERLEVLLALFDVIAVMLVRLRDLARKAPDGSASAVLNPVQMRVLRARVEKLSASPTARDALRAVAQLGGFLARRSDGEPGWRTLWRGMQTLLILEEGYHLGRDPEEFSRTCG